MREKADELARWVAVEAVRNAEVRLAAQAASLLALEARAMAIIGWASVVVAAGIAAYLTPALAPHMRYGAIVLATGFMAAILMAMRVLAPRTGWGVPGIEPEAVLRAPGPSVAHAAAWIAGGYEGLVATNSARLNEAGRRINAALRLIVGAFFAAAAVIAALGAAQT